jgi:hypothetical protein
VSAIKLNKKFYINFPCIKACDIFGNKLGNIKKLALNADSLGLIRLLVDALQLISVCIIY